MVQCVTCGKRMRWQEAQAGHFVQGRSRGILFDERGVHPQCYACNVVHHGQLDYYYEYMMCHYGPDVIDDLRRKRHQNGEWARYELLALLNQYERRLENLK